jgi:hypothetical protein
MGILSDRMIARHGDSTVEIESKLTFGTPIDGVVRYRLLIDNEIACEEKGHIGRCTLRGSITRNNSRHKAVIATIDQGFFGTNYQLSIDGEEVHLTATN